MDWLLLLAIFGTALLSSVFGMAGGLLLLLVLSLRMPLPEALVVHGAAQLVANSARAVISSRHLRGSVLGPYALAAGASLLLCQLAGLVLSTAAALIITGASPWAAPVLTRARIPAVDQPGGAALCGGLVTLLHLTAGVSGPLLDLFFYRSTLRRHEVVATKAVSQCLGHLLKIIYFGGLSSQLPVHAVSGWVAIGITSIAGTLAGRSVLDRLDERAFRSGSRVLIRVIGLACVGRGLWVMLAPTCRFACWF